MKTQLDTYEVTRRYLLDNATVLGTQIVNRGLGLVRNRDFANLAQLSSTVGPHINGLNAFKAVRQVEAFFKKNASFADDSVCGAAALTSFTRGERLCRITNRRLDFYHAHLDRLDPDMRSWLSRMEYHISDILGPIRPFMDEIPHLLRVTSGATALSPRKHSIPFMKFKRRMDCSPGSAKYLKAAYQFFGYKPPHVDCISWNRVEFVPKSWKTHRTIACEPTGNIPFQLAFDSYVKSRLQKHGIDLSDQTRNQHLAYVGSLGGGLATIDLSMASDTVSYNTVAWMLPHPWFKYLEDTRCRSYRLAGEEKVYAKFSSMGNGATFSLETLLFFAAVKAVGSKVHAVYGDDIVIEEDLAPKLLRLLRFLGFLPNVDKSYLTGPFRESCGCDYYEGVDVTPFYIRDVSDWDKPNLCHNLNGLARVSHEGLLWSYVRDLTVQAKLPLVPYSYDTAHGVFIHPSHAYEKKRLRSKGQILKSKGYVRKGTTRHSRDSRSLALWFLNRNHRVPEQMVRISLRDYALQFRETPTPATRYTASSTKYVQKWVGWVYPAGKVPEDAFAFSEYLLHSEELS